MNENVSAVVDELMGVGRVHPENGPCRYGGLALLRMEPMLRRDLLDRITVVLVRARNPNNIGAAARAMHDFGFGHLRVVNEFSIPFEAARSAVDASEVLRKAEAYTKLAEAIADCTLVFGTSAVGDRELRHPLLTVAEAGATVHEELARSPGSRIALLFGSEKTGLSNDELSLCHAMATIPMYAYEGVRHPSMNLGQAVAVCLYEIVRESQEERTMPEPGKTEVRDLTCPDRLTSAELERLTEVFSEMLEVTGYTRRHPAHAGRADLNRLVRRMALDGNSAQVWMGIFRQVLWKVTGASRSPKDDAGRRDRDPVLGEGRPKP